MKIRHSPTIADFIGGVNTYILHAVTCKTKIQFNVFITRSKVSDNNFKRFHLKYYACKRYLQMCH